MSNFKIYKSQRKAAYMLMVAAVFVVGGILLLHNSDKNVAGWSCIILGALGMVVGIYGWLDRAPQIVLSEQGISDRTFRNDVVEWNAILASDDFFFRGQYYIRLLVSKDYKPHIQHRSGWFQRIDRIYAREGVRGIYLKISMLDVNSVTLNKMIRRKAVARQGVKE